MKIAVLSVLFFFVQIVNGQITVEDSLNLEPEEDFEVVEEDYFGYDITNAKLSNKKALFKAIYKNAKRKSLLTGETIRVSVFIDSTGKIGSAEFYGVDSAYTFIRKIFLTKAKYTVPSTSKGNSISQFFSENITLSKEFLLGGFEYLNDDKYGFGIGEKITSFEKEYSIRVKVSEVFHNGIAHKVKVNEKVKIVNQRTRLIELSDSVAVYFEFPQVTFRTEKSFICRYYFKEKIEDEWMTRCTIENNSVGYYNTSFSRGKSSCGALDDPKRLEVELDFSIEQE